MSLVIDALDAPLADRAHVLCLSDGSRARTLSELGHDARLAASWLQNLGGRNGTVAALLTASHDCLALFFGALRSGQTLVSLPHPARGMDGAEYLAQINLMCAQTGATHLLCDATLTSLLSDAAVPVRAFGEYHSSVTAVSMLTPGQLVQFTSGSTGVPRGIALSLDALEANLASMYHWLEPRGDAVVCSWLPLSHDMGLIGLALYGICSVSPPWSVPTDLVLMTPESFLTDPSSWLRACSDYRATSTTSPPFALRLAARALRGAEHFDLSTVRSFVVGSEPVPAQTLRDFEEVARAAGLSPNALCPGYGMAEATLAVAIDPHTEPWSSVRVDSAALAEREWLEVESGGTELVTCGPPVHGMELRVAGDSAFGELELRGPSLLSHFVPDEGSALTEDGWFRSADVAHLHNGAVCIAGRTDDVLIVAGRNLDARALDAVVGTQAVCRPGNAACFSDGAGRYVVVAEPSAAGADVSDLQTGAREIRAALTRRFAAAPSEVVFIERGSLPKTPSGKVRRGHLRGLWVEGKLAELASG
ncbi:MAG TPA: AMP-binding protein [Acidimicrobiales bacterium]|nr:AMP-binding protein [Acidimicrobiales bacterium]